MFSVFLSSIRVVSSNDWEYCIQLDDASTSHDPREYKVWRFWLRMRNRPPFNDVLHSLRLFAQIGDIVDGNLAILASQLRRLSQLRVRVTNI